MNRNGVERMSGRSSSGEGIRVGTEREGGGNREYTKHRDQEMVGMRSWAAIACPPAIYEWLRGAMEFIGRQVRVVSWSRGWGAECWPLRKSAGPSY